MRLIWYYIFYYSYLHSAFGNKSMEFSFYWWKGIFPFLHTKSLQISKKKPLPIFICSVNQLLMFLPFSALFWITKPINSILPFKMQVQIYTQCRHSSTFNRLNSTNFTNIIPVANEKCMQQFSSVVENILLCLQNSIITYSWSENYLTVLKSS